MAFKVVVSPRAQQEIENAIDYYAKYSSVAPINFINILNDTYLTLSFNPQFVVVYKNIRVLKINKFPHSLYFTVNENTKTVKILSCFHNKRNPDKRPIK